MSTLQAPSTVFVPAMALEGSDEGRAELPSVVFGLEPRRDLLARCVRWQLAKRRAGTHAAKGRSDVDRTTKKLHSQKGTGNARHGATSAPQFRGGGKAHGPVPRDHAHDLPKKVRALALRHALSAKARDASLLVVKDGRLGSHKTKVLKQNLLRLNLTNALIITGPEVDRNLKLASRAIANVTVQPVQGLNVYDILWHDTLVLTPEAVEHLDGRFRTESRIAWQGGARIPNPGADGGASALMSRRASRKAPVDKPHPAARRSEREGTVNPYSPAWRHSDLIRLLRALSGGDGGQRKDAMLGLRTAQHVDPLIAEESKARLLPVLVSGDPAEAVDAAVTLCTLAYPDRYSEVRTRVGATGEAPHGLLDQVREDLRRLLREEHIDFVAYAERLPGPSGSPGTVRIRARVSRDLPFDLGGEPARLDPPEWLMRTRSFRVEVSGDVAPGSVRTSKVEAGVGDLAATVVECRPARSGAGRLIVDFFADHRWLERREIAI